MRKVTIEPQEAMFRFGNKGELMPATAIPLVRCLGGVF